VHTRLCATGRAAGLDVCIEFGFVFDRGSAAEPVHELVVVVPVDPRRCGFFEVGQPVEGDRAQVIGPADADGSVLRVNGE
jgi:hypothetical protein